MRPQTHKQSARLVMRNLILILIGVVLIGLAGYTAKVLIDNKNKPKPIVPKVIKTVFLDTVSNSAVPIAIKANGSLTAKRKIEIYSEVQGIFKSTNKPFKPGVDYSRGQLLLSLDGKEYYSSLIAQRSNLYDLITSIMPDLRLDYPEAFAKWDKYLREFDINRSVKPLPKAASDKEHYFITGRQIVSSYYNVKNMQERYAKYQIRAPFNGVLTEALVNPGTLVRAGQKLGEFIDPSVFELEVSINESYSDLLKVGKSVMLNDLNYTKTWEGKVTRVNSLVDQSTQTVTVYIQASGEGLKEGMYLEANVQAREEQNAIEIPRKLLVDESKLFVFQDSVLKLQEVNPVYFTQNTVVIRGLEDGIFILEKSVPGAYDGMRVKPFQPSGKK